MKNNNDKTLEKIFPELLQFKKNNKLKDLLNPDEYEYAFRILTFKDTKELKDILDIDHVKKDSLTTKGTLKSFPNKNSISSWTVNPRSLVYSGFCSTIKGNPNLILVKAKIKDNDFIGNPDNLTGILNVGDGYSLEREILGMGDIHYEKAVYGFLEKDQSIEGLLMDLINKLSNLKDIEFNDKYYYPKVF